MYFLGVSLWFLTYLHLSVAKKCSSPDLPDFTKPVTPERDEYDEDAHFRYRCIPNYHFEPQGTEEHKIVCSNGHWSPTPFYKCTDDCKNKCQHGTCKKTVDPETRQTVAFCLCQKNYAGERCDARVCEVEPLKPHHLPPIPSSTIGDGKYPLETIITFRCSEGYIIKTGRNQARCKPEGWAPSVPECEEAVCMGHDFFHGSYSPGQRIYNANSKVQFICHDGFRLTGSSFSNCVNGRWYPKWPTCEGDIIQVCTKGPPRVPHAYIIGAKDPPYTVGTAVQYRCQKRFYIEGNSIVKCTSFFANPSWETIPTCHSIDACADSNKFIQKKADGLLYCVSKGRLNSRTSSSTVKPLTIVTATAGGLLVLLLIVISLVAYQRRRIAISNRRQTRAALHNENDHFSFVYYTNDVHVVLPSYDEAVQEAPPPYGGNNATTDDDNADHTVDEYTEDTAVSEATAPNNEHNEHIIEATDEVIGKTTHANSTHGPTNENSSVTAGHAIVTARERNESVVSNTDIGSFEDPLRDDDTVPLIDN